MKKETAIAISIIAILVFQAVIFLNNQDVLKRLQEVEREQKATSAFMKELTKTMEKRDDNTRVQLEIIFTEIKSQKQELNLLIKNVDDGFKSRDEKITILMRGIEESLANIEVLNKEEMRSLKRDAKQALELLNQGAQKQDALAGKLNAIDDAAKEQFKSLVGEIKYYRDELNDSNARLKDLDEKTTVFISNIESKMNRLSQLTEDELFSLRQDIGKAMAAIEETRINLIKSGQLLMDGQYDNTGLLVPKKEVQLTLNYSLTLTVFFVNDQMRSGWLARAFVIEAENKSYIFAAAHVLFNEKMSTYANQVVWNNEKLKPIFLDPAHDVAIFEAPKLIKGGLKIGSSQELREGLFAMVIGFPTGSGTMVRDGIIANVKALDVVSDFTKTFAPALSKEDMSMLSYVSVSGDSGSPVLASRDGKLEVVGFIQGNIDFNQATFGWFVKSAVIIQSMREQGVIKT
ncbi:MAG: trypsin-like peptidase domain-containing protein [Candidatus Nealsonbacteria bacterium]|nr:trypsin-like peptidase domain-containing protein [Candidatus Nealsonbacteria bacterium]